MIVACGHLVAIFGSLGVLMIIALALIVSK